MYRLNRPLAILFACLCLVLPGLAQSAPRLNGAGIHYAVTEEIYIAAIYLESPAKTASDALAAKGAKRMEMRVVAESLRSRAFATLWLQMININNTPDDVTAFTSEIQQFSNTLEDKLEFGDALAIDLQPGNGVTVTINGVPVQHFEKDAFFNILLRCWIGSRSPSNEFTRNLLGLESGNADIIDRFKVTLPASGRKQAIAAWSSASTLAAATPKAVADVAAPAPKPAVKPASPPPPARPQPASSTVVAAPEPVATPAPAATEPVAVPLPEPVATPEPAPAAPEPEIAAPEPAPAAPKPETAAPEPAAAGEDTGIADGASTTVDAETLRKTHRAYILRDTYKKVRYPQSAASRNQEGEVVVTVTVKRDGSLVSAAVTTRSYPSLNNAAEKAVQEAAPFTPAPDELPGDSFTYELPIKFKVPR